MRGGGIKKHGRSAASQRRADRASHGAAARLHHTATIPNATHELKTWPRFFSEILAGRKRHELRRNDRDFHSGDTLLLREFDPDTAAYTGREQTVVVTYTTADDNPCALSAWGLKDGFCILSIAQAGEAGTAETPKSDSVHEHAVRKADAPK